MRLDDQSYMFYLADHAIKLQFDIVRWNFEEDERRLYLQFDINVLAELLQTDEFLVSEIIDITLLQVCHTLQYENAAIEGLLNLSLTTDSAGCGAMDIDGIKTEAMDVDCKDSASTSSESCFGKRW